MADRQERFCATCQYYDPWGEDRGDCRRSPPVATANRTESSHPSEVWPTVLEDDWCGQHCVRLAGVAEASR